MPAGSSAFASNGSTVPAEPTESWTRWERRFRLASVTLISAIVLLAAVGLLGVRTGTAVSVGGGYSIEVLHAEISRPGLATPLTVDISTVDGSALPSTITLRVDAAYLATFDVNVLQPTPTDTFNTEDWTWWTFDVPVGQRSLRVRMDARLEPSVQWARSGTVALDVEGEGRTSVDLTTWVMP